MRLYARTDGVEDGINKKILYPVFTSHPRWICVCSAGIDEHAGPVLFRRRKCCRIVDKWLSYIPKSKSATTYIEFCFHFVDEQQQQQQQLPRDAPREMRARAFQI